MNAPIPPEQAGPEITPWWRVKALWLVIGGPAVVVLASVATGVLAARGSDPVVPTQPAAQSRGAADLAQAPALQARNHAATVAGR